MFSKIFLWQPLRCWHYSVYIPFLCDRGRQSSAVCIAASQIYEKIYKSGTKLKETRVKYSTNITEQVNNAYTIKCNNMYSKVEAIFEGFFSKLFNTVISYFRNIFKFQSLDNIITVIIQILFLFFGVYLFSENSITIGQLTITLSLYGMMISSVRYYVNLSVQYSECKASIARMDELNSIQSEKSGTMDINGTIQKITIKN